MWILICLGFFRYDGYFFVLVKDLVQNDDLLFNIYYVFLFCCEILYLSIFFELLELNIQKGILLFYFVFEVIQLFGMVINISYLIECEDVMFIFEVKGKE